MIKFWMLSSLWIFFMILGVTFIQRKQIQDNFIEIFGEGHAEIIKAKILFDDLSSLIICSFIPLFNVFYLIVYLTYGFCDKNGTWIQLLKTTHEKNEEDKKGSI